MNRESALARRQQAQVEEWTHAGSPVAYKIACGAIAATMGIMGAHYMLTRPEPLIFAGIYIGFLMVIRRLS